MANLHIFHKTENIALVISLIGCFTGLFGLMISIYNLYRERYQLEIVFSNGENWFFPRLENYNTYQTGFQAVVRFNLINCSSHPISIYDLQIKLDDEVLRYESYSDKTLTLLITYEKDFPHRKQYYEVPMHKQHYFPIRLNAHETYDAFLFIAYFPSIKATEAEASFLFKTTKKSTKKTCKLKLITPHEASPSDEIQW